MVSLRNRFLIDATFIVERHTKRFSHSDQDAALIPSLRLNRRTSSRTILEVWSFPAAVMSGVPKNVLCARSTINVASIKKRFSDFTIPGSSRSDMIMILKERLFPNFMPSALWIALEKTQFFSPK